MHKRGIMKLERLQNEVIFKSTTLILRLYIKSCYESKHDFNAFFIFVKSRSGRDILGGDNASEGDSG